MKFENLKMTSLINGFSLFKIPLLAFVRPRVQELNQTKSVVKIKLGWSTKNHLGSMYFGALAMGAELSIALKLVEFIKDNRAPIDFIFKDFHSDFLKRADGDVLFICDQGAAILELANKSMNSVERIEQSFDGYAVTSNDPNKVIMNYRLTLSIKKRLKTT